MLFLNLPTFLFTSSHEIEALSVTFLLGNERKSINRNGPVATCHEGAGGPVRYCLRRCGLNVVALPVNQNRVGRAVVGMRLFKERKGRYEADTALSEKR